MIFRLCSISLPFFEIEIGISMRKLVCFFPSIEISSIEKFCQGSNRSNNFVYIVNVRTHLLRIRPKRWCPMLFVQLTVCFRIRTQNQKETKQTLIYKISYVRDEVSACMRACDWNCDFVWKCKSIKTHASVNFPIENCNYHIIISRSTQKQKAAFNFLIGTIFWCCCFDLFSLGQWFINKYRTVRSIFDWKMKIEIEINWLLYCYWVHYAYLTKALYMRTKLSN